MKKTFLLLAVLSALFTACSNDNDNDATDSGIRVNGEAFLITPDDVSATGIYRDPDVHERSFIMRRPAGNGQPEASIEVHIVTHDTDASGTYSASPPFPHVVGPDEDYFTGSYFIGDIEYYFSLGETVTIKDYGDNKTYKLTFHNVTGGTSGGGSVEITGTYKGTFADGFEVE